jgi:elongation factor G
MKRIYEVSVQTKLPKIAYRETITAAAQGHYKHKKQTGGRGQYAEVYIKIEPANRGDGFIFVDQITQGRIPKQFIPSVEKGIKNAMDMGILAGYNVCDIKVYLYDGTFHEVDSSDISFQIAGGKAFKLAFAEAKPVLLEPIVNIEVIAPLKYVGDITGNLTSRRARIMGVDSYSDMFNVIKAQVPLAEVLGYSSELRSQTGGEGSYSLEFSHYDIVPKHIAEKIIAKARAQMKEEEE